MFKGATAFSGFSVPDIEAAKSFYGDRLGLELKEEMSGSVFGFSVGGQRIFVYGKPDHEPAGYTVLNFEVDDINVAVDGLVGKGITMERYDDLPAAQDERGILRGKAAGMGPDIAWFKDLGGNVLAVVES